MLDRNPTIRTCALGALLGTLGCDFIGEKISEKVAEEVIERSIEKEHGGNVDVDIEKGGGTLSVKGAAGKGSMEIGKGSKVPDDFPKEVPVYPGADVLAAMSGGDKKGSGHMLTLQTADHPDKIVEFYRDKLSGFEKKGEMSTGEMRMVVLQDEKSKLNVSVTATRTDDKTHVQLTVANK